MYGVRVCSDFTDLHEAVYLLKRHSFLQCIFLPPWLKMNGPSLCGEEVFEIASKTCHK